MLLCCWPTTLCVCVCVCSGARYVVRTNDMNLTCKLRTFLGDNSKGFFEG